VAEELLHVGLGGVLESTRRTFDVAEVFMLVMLVFELLEQDLLNVLSDLLRQEVSQLGANLIPVIEVSSQLEGIVALADKDVFAASLANLNSQGEDLLPLFGLVASGGRGTSRRTFIVLPRLGIHRVVVSEVVMGEVV